jgi:hypothetical protein
MTQEVLGQLGLIYGGLILIGVYRVQPFLTAPSLDASAKVTIVSFAVAIPLLAALVMVNRQEAFRGRLTTSRIVAVTRVVAQNCAFVGIVAGFWQAGIGILPVSIQRQVVTVGSVQVYPPLRQITLLGPARHDVTRDTLGILGA